jgi:hypothetical protein
VIDFITSSPYAIDKRNDRARFPGAIWRQTWELESQAALEADGMSHAMAVRHARDKIRGQVIEFVEKHHQSESGKGKSK